MDLYITKIGMLNPQRDTLINPIQDYSNLYEHEKYLCAAIKNRTDVKFSEFKDTVISRFINENIKKELFQDKNQTRIIEIEKDIIKSKQYKINYFDIL